MTRRRRSRRRTGLHSLAALAAAFVLAPASAAAMSAAPSAGNLSPRLAELAKPSLRSASPARQAAALSVAPEGPGSVLRDGNRVVVEVRFDHGAAAALDDLRAAGAKVLNSSRRYQTVTVAATPAGLRAIAAVPRVGAVTEALSPIVYAEGAGGPIASAAKPCFGAATSEGDSQLRAAEARAAFGVDGSGVTVGILSDSFNQDGSAETSAAEDIASGDLPGPANPCGHKAPVRVLEDLAAGEEGEDEGRAMAQIVHDLAPGASLAFATAFSGEIPFAENIEKLAKPVVEGGAGAKVIADDVAYFDEPFFQDGPVADAVDRVNAAGTTYFSAAGNDNLIDSKGRDIASWEAPAFRDSASCPASLLALPGFGPGHCMDFNPEAAKTDNTFGLTVAKGATLSVDLQWAEPWFGVKTDLDAFLLNSKGERIEVEGFPVASAEDNVGGSEEPFEFLQWENTTGSTQQVQLAVNRCASSCNSSASSTATPRLKIALLENGDGVSATEYPESSGGDIVGPTIYGHTGAEGADSVGAVRYNTASAPEEFSSRGPVTHYLGPVEGTSPAAALGAPQVLAKPDLVATDGGANTFFGSHSAGVWRFFGTSAAAPHAAAVAALMLDANPIATQAQVRESLASTARPVGSFGPGAVGAGLIDAVAAVGDVGGVEVEGGEESEEGESTAEGGPKKEGGGSGTVPLPIPVAPDAEAPNYVPPPPPLEIHPRAPRTFFLERPRRTIRTRHSRAAVAFRFGSSASGATFTCRVDGGLYRPCAERLSRRFGIGWHSIRVIARDAAGDADRTPAAYRFRVERIN